MAAEIFVVGLDEFNRGKLQAVGPEGDYAFHPLLSVEEVTAGRDWSLERAVEHAMRIIGSVTGRADAIVGYWDFPVSLMVPILCRQLSLPSPSLESVLQCEHKYWSRLTQRRVAPEHTPSFQPLDPFDDESVGRIELPYPYWLKPVKSFASHLGFRIRGRGDLREATGAMRRHIRDLGDPFNQFLDRANVPEEVAAVDGNCCIAEAIVAGCQCTLEGFVHDGEVEIYGIVDSVRHTNRSSFARYEYPSRLPRAVTARMCSVAARVIEAVGLDGSPFNVELFWDAPRDRIWLLEINPRISQSHGDLFEKVDGVPHHKVVVDLALGRRPRWRPGSGAHRVAGKFFLRRFHDGIVTRAPSTEEILAVQRALPGTLVEIKAAEGMRLSELDPQDQDSYSYIYALVFIGAVSHAELMRRYRQCRRMLPFDFADVGGERTAQPQAEASRVRAEGPP